MPASAALLREQGLACPSGWWSTTALSSRVVRSMLGSMSVGSDSASSAPGERLSDPPVAIA